jgi:pimeloyl-ACP methyl ester carboxylesterase
VTRPRLLLVPLLTELEWDVIRPGLEEWAEVASFDVPGVGDEPAVETLDRETMAQRGLAELDRRGWDRCVVVTDGMGATTGTLLARTRPEAVTALALSHARLSNRMEGERAPVNREVLEALGQLLRQDYPAFIRHGLTQITHGSIADELAARIMERVPLEIGRRVWELAMQQEPIAELLEGLDIPLLFAQHEGCLIATPEGFEDALAAFPNARRAGYPDAPSVTPAFAEDLRAFCEELPAPS